MHPYTVDSAERQYVIFGLAVISFLIATAISPLLDNFSAVLGFAITSPSTFAIFGGLYFLFKKFLWKLPFLHIIGLVKVPNLNGEWEGEVKSSHDKFLNSYPIKMTIKQDWTHIVVRIKADKSTGHSYVAAILAEDSKGIVLTYQYQNKPNPESIKTMVIHEGTASLKLEGQKLEGEYYTGRGRTTHGKMEFVRSSHT